MHRFGAAATTAMQDQSRFIAGLDQRPECAGAGGVRSELPFLVEGGAETAFLFAAAGIDLEDRNGIGDRKRQGAGAARLVAEGEHDLLPALRDRKLQLCAELLDLDGMIGGSFGDKCR